MKVLALIVAGYLLTACNDQRSSQLFLSCTGDLTHSFRNGDYGQEPETTKATASLMLDEAKQALAFKPSGDTIPAIFAKTPDDAARKLSCAEINWRSDETSLKAGTGIRATHNCGEVWSNDTSLYFTLDYRSGSSIPVPVENVEIVETFNGRLDRITGRLEVSLSVSHEDENGKTSWGQSDWALVCKKVDKLVDTK